MLLYNAVKSILTMRSISSSAKVLIGFQVFLQILIFVDSQSSETSLNYTLYPDEDNGSDPNDLPEWEDKIAGGTPAEAGEFPFMAALGWINDSGDLKFHGGGMLISPRMVLTAAHCIYKDGKLPDIVFIGGSNLSESETFNVSTKFSVVNAIAFPQYVPNLGYDDIAILELNESTSFQPVCLWPNDDLDSDDVTAIGYGLTEFAGSGSQGLLKVNLTVFETDYCQPFFKRQRKFRSGLSNTHICAGDKDGIKDTCQGDSGGPLLTRHMDEMYALGITSSGQACSGFPPAIYTKIYPYTDWITDVLREAEQSLGICLY